MALVTDYPSATSTGVSAPSRTFVDPVESIGSPKDGPATVQNNTNSAFALVKGILAARGLSAGTGAGVTQVASRLNTDLMKTLGDKTDAAAASAGATSSAISLLKGICTKLGL